VDTFEVLDGRAVGGVLDQMPDMPPRPTAENCSGSPPWRYSGSHAVAGGVEGFRRAAVSARPGSSASQAAEDQVDRKLEAAWLGRPTLRDSVPMGDAGLHGDRPISGSTDALVGP
jgi:hypothetical protein